MQMDRLKKERLPGQSIPCSRRVRIPRPIWLDRDSVRAGRSPHGLFGFNGELRPVPLVPAALERIDVGKTLVDQLLCPTGTGKLIRSGTVQDQGGVFGILGG